MLADSVSRGLAGWLMAANETRLVVRLDETVTVDRLPGTPYASGEGRIARSWRLTRAAWRLVGHDDTLKGLAILGALAGLAGFALLLVLGGAFSGTRVSRGHILLVAAWPVR